LALVGRSGLVEQAGQAPQSNPQVLLITAWASALSCHRSVGGSRDFQPVSSRLRGQGRIVEAPDHVDPGENDTGDRLGAGRRFRILAQHALAQ